MTPPALIKHFNIFKDAALCFHTVAVIFVVHLPSGEVRHHIRFSGVVEELYDVAVIPGRGDRCYWGSNPMKSNI
jgi:hypothetical protein